MAHATTPEEEAELLQMGTKLGEVTVELETYKELLTHVVAMPMAEWEALLAAWSVVLSPDFCDFVERIQFQTTDCHGEHSSVISVNGTEVRSKKLTCSSVLVWLLIAVLQHQI